MCYRQSSQIAKFFLLTTTITFFLLLQSSRASSESLHPAKLERPTKAADIYFRTVAKNVTKSNPKSGRADQIALRTPLSEMHDQRWRQYTQEKDRRVQMQAEASNQQFSRESLGPETKNRSRTISPIYVEQTGASSDYLRSLPKKVNKQSRNGIDIVNGPPDLKFGLSFTIPVISLSTDKLLSGLGGRKSWGSSPEKASSSSLLKLNLGGLIASAVVGVAAFLLVPLVSGGLQTLHYGKGFIFDFIDSLVPGVFKGIFNDGYGADPWYGNGGQYGSSGYGYDSYGGPLRKGWSPTFNVVSHASQSVLNLPALHPYNILLNKIYLNEM